MEKFRCGEEDADGNQLTPEQVESGRYITSVLKDFSGVNTEPYLVRLTAGKHTVTLVSPKQTIAISSLEFTPPEKRKIIKTERKSKTIRRR
ncbi:MAG: hypothetical protein ACLR56_11750 [Oscillospiraceae bacterium]